MKKRTIYSRELWQEPAGFPFMKVIAFLLLTLSMPMSWISASTQVYTDKTAWEHAVGGQFLTEDFSDDQLNAGVSFVSSESGHINPAQEKYQDVLASASQNEPMTIWNFTPEITAYGGNWTLGGPGGSGNSLLVYIDDDYVGSIPNSFGGEFWGFTSDSPFTSVKLVGGSGTNQQQYSLDDMVSCVCEPDPAEFRRGDINTDSAINIADAVATLSYLFSGGTVTCLDAVDANDDGAANIADAVALLSYLFSGTGDLPLPFGKCGVDPTLDGLNCENYDLCETIEPTITVTLPGDVQLEMVSISSGTFMMGAKQDEQHRDGNEVPQHEVTLTKDFYLGKYEVTKRQWEAVMGTTPWAGQNNVLDDQDSPAVYINWEDVQEFIGELNKLGQGSFRLPTEAEWEYACRAGTTTRFYWGNDTDYTEIGDYAWYEVNATLSGEEYAHKVGQKLSNAWGLYDMSGNVLEWCHDWYDSNYYSGSSDTDPVGPGEGLNRVIRGGDWDGYAKYCRSATRSTLWPDDNYDCFIGFRLLKSIDH